MILINGILLWFLALSWLGAVLDAPRRRHETQVQAVALRMAMDGYRIQGNITLGGTTYVIGNPRDD